MRNKTSFCLALIAGLFLSSPPSRRTPMRCSTQLSDKAQTYKAYEIAYTSTLVDLKNDFELSHAGRHRPNRRRPLSPQPRGLHDLLRRRNGVDV